MKKLFIGLAGSSVLWGLVATFIFYFGVNTGLVRNETVVRYSTGHPVEYATIAMFWIGVVDIAFKLLATRRERRALDEARGGQATLVHRVEVRLSPDHGHIAHIIDGKPAKPASAVVIAFKSIDHGDDLLGDALDLSRD